MKKNNDIDQKKVSVYASCAIIIFAALVGIACIIYTDIISEPADVCEHEYIVIEQVDPTYDSDGKIVKKCNKCDQEKTEVLTKLERVTIKFDGLELTFGEYSFTTVDNRFSKYHNETIVKIPVTVKNISSSPNSLNSFDYTLFGTGGIESADVGYYFDDDISDGGELLSGKSYTRYFHIVYDGDGVYTIVFDDWAYDKETLEIYVTK